MEIIHIDPCKLVPNDLNLRDDVGDVSDLATSIEVLGLLQPLTVVDDRQREAHVVVAGHRRRAAAIEIGLETVPCIVAADAEAAGQIASMLGENLPRRGLRVTEEAKGYEQLTLLDWEPERIAKAAGRSAARVDNALAMRKLPEAAQQAADSGQLDLADAAELAADFADQPEATKRIIDRGARDVGPWGFKHAIAEERAKRDRKEAVDRLKAELVLDGVRVTSKPKGFGWDSKEAEASTLLDAEGKRLDPDKVVKAQGFRAFVEFVGDQPRTVVYCLDPEAWGYTRAYNTPRRDTVDPAAEEERRAAEAARLETAEAVRWEFLRERYSSAKATKPLYLEALRDAVADPRSIQLNTEYEELADSIAGTSIVETAGAAGLDRLSRMLVARWLASRDRHVAHAARGWHHDEYVALAYLDRLVDDGYALSEVEQELHDELSEAVAPAPADEEPRVDAASDADVDEPEPSGELAAEPAPAA
ncbi:MAG: ParB/RepB/Spo0J family partition protein [Stackebrandtia sp.]